MMCSTKFSFCLCIPYRSCYIPASYPHQMERRHRGGAALLPQRKHCLQVAHHWRAPWSNVSSATNLAQSHPSQPEECCREVLLGLWLENPPKDYPTTWQGLINLLKHSKLSEVVAQLRNALSKATDL